ncbi:metal ABC transporter solute-binding protein, Zn/Mn family [Shewanella sp. SR44-3]|uniref:metal ABC transporter solute-binding protein, Zn/Mn family n=1 Tax=unclassified Shewanella TaxID=196818 RepID=UPI0015FBC5F6|nr:zinc ABC transporter substrate-binding protein [Shewanella sp. SR44-3]MBB1268238.1 zinc ABC transporter substrate-binding protein [Shewanella sp. SR44-3]
MRINFKQKLYLGLIAFASLSSFYSVSAKAELNVFACEPEYAALVQTLAPNAKVYSATTAMQDPHQVQARPSLIAKLRQADLLVCAGADLEIGWLPMLQMKASNSQVLSTDKGLFFATEQVQTLDKLTQVDRSMGDVHEKGNPHVHFDPERMLQIAEALTQKLISLDIEHQAEYQQHFQRFSGDWQLAMKRWQQQAKPLQGRKVIAYHSSFRYLFAWLGMEQVADLEPKPGLAPTTSHLVSLLERTKMGDVMAVVVASYQDERGGLWLAERANLPMLVLPMSVGGNDDSTDLISLYDSVLGILTNAVKSTEVESAVLQLGE